MSKSQQRRLKHQMKPSERIAYEIFCIITEHNVETLGDQKKMCRDIADWHIDKVAQLEAELAWMRREIERVGHALYTGTETGYVGTEEDLHCIGQTVEGVIETMDKLEADRDRWMQGHHDLSMQIGEYQDKVEELEAELDKAVAFFEGDDSPMAKLEAENAAAFELLDVYEKENERLKGELLEWAEWFHDGEPANSAASVLDALKEGE